MFNPETANCLPNGAVILDRSRVGDRWFWLCDRGGCLPYVTWVSMAENPGATVHGHYFSKFEKALCDFSVRIQESWLENGFGSVC